jgi:hypothetical protein
VNVALGVSAREEHLTVEETAESIDVEKSEVSQVIDAPKISDLPISGRDFIDFVLLTPSVNVGRSTAVGAQSPFTETVLKLSFAGTRESHTSFFALDGVDYTTSISGVQRVSPSQDWVQEFRVIDSPYSADAGRNLGSVVNTITKSGSNNFHGSLYEYFRTDALDAKNVLSAPGFTTLRFNQFGGTIGGPVRKDKVFFFAGYEGQRRAESPIYSRLILSCIDSTRPGFVHCPFPTGINQVKENLGLKPENLGSILQIDDYDKFIPKFTAVLSDKSTLTTTYLFNDSRKQNVRGAAPGEGLPSSYRNNPVRDQTLYGDLIHVFSPTLTSDSLLQYGRRVFHLTPVGEGFEPAINIPDVLSGGGFVGSISFYKEQHLEASESLTYVHGNHTVKFGGEFHPVWTSAQVPLFSPAFGIFCLDSFFGVPATGCTGPVAPPAGSALVFLFLEPREAFGTQLPNRNPNFQAGLFAGPSEQQFNNATTLSYMHTLYSGYVQDQWRLRPNLSLTAGLRYDVDNFPSAADMKTQCAPGAPSNCFHPTNYNNFQPRLAFAYSFNRRTVIRGGGGLFVAPFVYSDVMVSWIGASEFTYMHNPFEPEFANPAQNLIGFGASGAVGMAGPPAATALRNFIATGQYPAPGQLAQFPLGYAQRKFNAPRSAMGSLEVEHQFGRDLYVNLGYQYVHASRLPAYRSINGDPTVRPPVDGKTLFVPINQGAGPPFGFVLMVNPIGWSIYNAGTLSVRKPFSHNFSLLANYTYSKSIDISTTVSLPNTPQDYLHPYQDRGVGDNDIRHRFTLAVLGESPRAWPQPFRDFKLSLLTTLQSPRRFTINTGFDTNGDIFPFNDRVDNIPRNTYVGAAFYDVDVRLQRVIPVTERVKCELSAEAFNIFNRVNVEDVDHVYGAPVFVGPIPHSFGDGITAPNPSFGTPKFVAAARQIQLSLRFSF